MFSTSSGYFIANKRASVVPQEPPATEIFVLIFKCSSRRLASLIKRLVSLKDVISFDFESPDPRWSKSMTRCFLRL